MRLRRGGKQRRRNLALLAMAIAIKEENVQRGIETTTPELPTVPNPTGGAQGPNPERDRVSVEVRKMF